MMIVVIAMMILVTRKVYLESNAVEPAVVPQVLLVEVRVRLVLVKDDNDDNGDDSD